MKTIIITLCIAFFFLSFSKISFAQEQDYYYTFKSQIAIPVIVDYKNIWRDKDWEPTKEDHQPEKQEFLQFHFMSDEMIFNGSKFSGKNISKSVMDDSWREVKTFSGEVSDDRRWIKYLEMEIEYILESWGDNELRRTFVRIENIPIRRIYKNDDVVKEYQFKNAEEPLWKKDYFLPEASDIVSKVTKIEYDGRKILQRLTSDAEEILNKLVSMDNKSIAEGTSNITCNITMLKRKNIPIMTIEELNKGMLDCKLTMEKRVYKQREILSVIAEVKEDLIENMWVGLLPDDIPLDWIHDKENGLVKQKIKQTIREIPFFTDYNSGSHSVVLYSFNPDTKKINKCYQLPFTILKKDEYVGSIKIWGNNSSFNPGQDIQILYHENEGPSKTVTDMWVGLLSQDIEPELTLQKSDFINTKDITLNKNEKLPFKAPNEPGKYKFLLFKEVIPYYIAEVHFTVE